MELVNPTAAAIDLTGYALGDAVPDDGFRGQALLPAGDTHRGQSPFGRHAFGRRFRAAFGVEPDLEIANSDPLVPDMLDDPPGAIPRRYFSWAIAAMRLSCGGAANY